MHARSRPISTTWSRRADGIFVVLYHNDSVCPDRVAGSGFPAGGRCRAGGRPIEGSSSTYITWPTSGRHRSGWPGECAGLHHRESVSAWRSRGQVIETHIDQVSAARSTNLLQYLAGNLAGHPPGLSCSKNSRQRTTDQLEISGRLWRAMKTWRARPDSGADHCRSGRAATRYTATILHRTICANRFRDFSAFRGWG